MCLDFGNSSATLTAVSSARWSRAPANDEPCYGGIASPHGACRGRRPEATTEEGRAPLVTDWNVHTLNRTYVLREPSGGYAERCRFGHLLNSGVGVASSKARPSAAYVPGQSVLPDIRRAAHAFW